MNRKSFFRTLGLGAVAAIVAPKVLAGPVNGVVVTSEPCVTEETGKQWIREALDTNPEIEILRNRDFEGYLREVEEFRGRRKHNIRYLTGTDWSKILNE